MSNSTSQFYLYYAPVLVLLVMMFFTDWSRQGKRSTKLFVMSMAVVTLGPAIRFTLLHSEGEFLPGHFFVIPKVFFLILILCLPIFVIILKRVIPFRRLLLRIPRRRPRPDAREVPAHYAKYTDYNDDKKLPYYLLMMHGSIFAKKLYVFCRADEKGNEVYSADLGATCLYLNVKTKRFIISGISKRFEGTYSFNVSIDVITFTTDRYAKKRKIFSAQGSDNIPHGWEHTKNEHVVKSKVC